VCVFCCFLCINDTTSYNQFQKADVCCLTAFTNLETGFSIEEDLKVLMGGLFSSGKKSEHKDDKRKQLGTGGRL
jgi:hypothetical protein